MSTNSPQTLQPFQQWFWPTNHLFSPLMDTNNKSIDNNSKLTTNVSTATYHRRHRHWWKVCWIYNNGNLICQGINKQSSNIKQFQHQLQQNRLNPITSSHTTSLLNDRCVNEDDNLFSMAKQNSSTNSEEVQISSREQQQQQQREQQSQQQLWTSSLNCSPQVCSSGSSGFLQQKLTQPFTALLKQKCEHKNSIAQFFIQYKGADWRADQLQYQIPTHDIQMLKQPSIEVKFVRNQQRKAQIKPQLFFNKSSNFCFKCKKPLEIGSNGVKISVTNNGSNNNGYSTTTDDEDNTALKINSSDTTHSALNGSTALYHIECFTCEECQQVLVDLKAFLYNNNTDSSDPSKVNSNLYCCRHFVELFKPRCQYCDHLIFDDECTEAEGKAWHIGHFCCTECKRSLGGQQYIMANPRKQTDKKSIYETKNQILEQQKQKQQLPYCLTCFDILFGELCEECGELIGCDVGAISHEGRSWHARDICFKCNMCSKALLGKPFLPAFDGRIYCSITCSQEAIHRNRYRQRKKPKEISNNNLSKKFEKCHINQQTDGQSLSPLKPTIDTNLQIKSNQHNFSEKQSELQRLTNNNNYHSYQIRKEINDLREDIEEKFTENDRIVSKPNDRIAPNINALNQNSTNLSMDEQMLDYIQKYQQFSKAPNYVLEYMKQQLIQNQSNANNRIIGASIEYGSSLSEDERTNQQTFDRNNVSQNAYPLNDPNYVQMTSSTSSSLNATTLDLNNSIINSNPLKYRQLVTHSSSSNETTPLLLRPFSSNDRTLENENKPSEQTHRPVKPLLNRSKIYSEQSLPNSESPSQVSQDQSSNSSYNEHINKNNSNHSKVLKVLTESKSPELDTPSTQSTAIQSTSSQTTPETNPRSANKSVTFDPSVKETTSNRRLNRKFGHSKSRSNRNNHWSDNHSCSTCSTCSSSSSSTDDDFDYESTLERSRNQWLGGTKIQYVNNERKKNLSNLVQENGAQSESCTIS